MRSLLSYFIFSSRKNCRENFGDDERIFGEIFVSSIFKIRSTVLIILIFRSFVNNFTNLALKIFAGSLSSLIILRYY